MSDNDNNDSGEESLPPESSHFEAEALTSRYSAEVEQDQQQRQQQQQQQGPTESNVDQSVNLMDVNAGNYAALEDDGDKGKQNKSSKPPSTAKLEGTAGPSVAFTGALVGGEDGDTNKPSNGWTTVPRQEKARRHSWDTSLVGRLAIWLVFFLTMILFTFLIPYWVIGVHSSDGTNGVAKDRSFPLGKPVSPSVQSRMDNIKSIIIQNAITSSSDLEDQLSDAHYALRWLTEADPAQIEPLVNHRDNTELLQRYSMAVLYYATHPLVENTTVESHQTTSPERIQPLKRQDDNGNGGSGSIIAADDNVGDESPKQRLPDEAPALEQRVHLNGHGESSVVAHKTPPPQSSTKTVEQGSMTHVSLVQRDGEEDTRVANVERDSQRTRRVQNSDNSSSPSGWLREHRWMTSAAVCDWYGVECETLGPHKVIRQLNLTSNELKGTLPSELQTLTHLDLLDLSNNHLSGGVPLILWRKLHLSSLVLARNQLSGSLPVEIATLTKVKELDLSFNTFQGTIPTEVNRFRQLRVLNLEGNQLRGTIPSLVELKDLSVLRLGDNQITGDIPYHVSLLNNLLDLGLQGNSLTGKFLTEIEGLHFLKRIDLSRNQIQGELPDAFERLHSLESLNLEQNIFTSTLPPSIGLLGQLTSLVLSSNTLEGPLPRAWAGMTSLQRLSLENNALSGKVPKYFGRMTSLQNLTLSANFFTGEVPKRVAANPSLANFHLETNDLNGSMPSKFCDLKEAGFLKALTADCNKVKCECCDNCGNQPQGDELD